VSNPADQVAVAARRGSTSRAWFAGDTASYSSPFDDAKELKRHAIGVCVLADGNLVGVTPDGEQQTYVFGTGGLALGVFHPFKLRQIRATSTTVTAANLYLAEGK